MKRTIELQEPAFKGDHYYCHGNARVIVLEGRYDPDQLWLDFAGETILFRQTFEPPTLAVAPVDAKKVTPKRLKRKLQPPPETMQPYLVFRDVHQHPLPIDKWQIPSKSMTARIRSADYPCFERDEEGNLYRLRYIGSGVARPDNADLRAWVNRNCAGRVLLDGWATFEKGDDHLFAMISGNFSKSEQ